MQRLGDVTMQSRPLQFHASMLFNKIYFFQSLKFEPCTLDNDIRTTTNLFSDFIPSLQKRFGFLTEFLEIDSKQAFVSRLDHIFAECLEGVRPIIHIDMHGSKTLGLRIEPTGDFLAWEELANKCRQINLVCHNNLMLILTSCFGLNSIRNVTILKPTPYYALIGAEKNPPGGYIDNQFPGFYETLLTELDIDKALEHISEHYKLYLSEEHFAVAFTKYIREGCMGKGKQMRVEKLVSDHLVSQDSYPKLKLRDARKLIKENIRPSPDKFEFYKNRFLLANDIANRGRFNLNIEDISSFLKENL